MQLAKSAKSYSRSMARYFGRQNRDARYVFVLIISGLVLLLSTLQALSQGLFDSVERPIFQFINHLPNYLGPLMFLLTQFGGLGSLLVWAGAAWYLINRRAALTVIASGSVAWFIAKLLKDFVARGRPDALLHSVNLFSNEHFGGFGFPSGHSTFSAACATVLYYQVDRRYRKYILMIVGLVGFSRMYLGAHFPLDVIGGWALGAFVGSLICLIFGVSVKGISAARLKSLLNKKGYHITSLKFADVDARGSRPLFFTTVDGTDYFAKIFGAQEHASDWLFKIYRFFRYKNLQAEEPYISGRRNIELESFAMLWASQHGVRVPKLCDVVRIGSSWMLVQEKVDAKPLDESSRIHQKALVEAWRQVNALHQSNMAHRDLRAANLMLGSNDTVWLIDFGFAELSPRRQRICMDNAELLMSMSLVVGVKRTVDAAISVVDAEQLKATLPYLQRQVFSGATTKQLSNQRELLAELKATLAKRLGVTEEIDEADIVRFNRRKIINIALLGLFVYFILPQFVVFRGSLRALAGVNPLWLIGVAATSLLTYFLTATIYIALTSVPIRLWPATLVQLAASFMSKIVPGGVGGTSLNARYLKKSGLDAAETAAVLTAQGVIGFVMFIVPLLMFLLLNRTSIRTLLSFHITTRELYAVLAALIVAVVLLWFAGGLRKKVLSFISNFATSIRGMTNSPREIMWAAAASLGVTLCYIVCLYCCMQAFGVHLGLAAATFIYASAVIAKTVIPTPGGLGPLEIAMVSSMVGFGVLKPTAIAVMVLYRLATFWLPIPLSVLAYRHLSQRRII